MLGMAARAQDDVYIAKDGESYTMGNGLVELTIGSNGRINNLHLNGKTNVIGSSGVYFDYTAASNTGLNPTESRVVKQTADYAEVVYSNTKADLRIDQGFIMRRGISGVYVYVVAHGSEKSSAVNVREARVCTRLNSSFTNGYVDETMRGKIPTCREMEVAEREENTIQDATYRMADGSIYTKYNWAQYVVKDSLHGLMNINVGVWNIPCSHEWLNGGPMRQELTVHATSKSPITIQMLQRDDRPDAILAFNDIITYAAFDAIKTLGLRIPEDVAIIGFTETDTSFFVTPKLSAIMDQAHLTGERACELLLKNIAGDKRIYKEVVPMILKIRESSDKNISIQANK